MTRTILRQVAIAAAAAGLFMALPLGAAQGQAQEVRLAQAAQDQTEQIKEFQRKLQALGLYSGAIDGIVGPGTWGAWEQFASAANVGREPTPESWQLLFDAAEVARARNATLNDAIENGKHLRTAIDTIAVGGTLMNPDSFLEAAELFESALPTLKSVLYPEHEYVIHAVTQLITAYEQKGRILQSNKQYEDALALFQCAAELREGEFEQDYFLE